MKPLVKILSFLLISGTCLAQSTEPELDNPYISIYNHLNLLHQDNFYPKMAGKTLNFKGDPQKAASLAIKLKQFLDGKGLYVTYDGIPRDPNYMDSLSGKHKYVLFEKYPLIYVEKVENKWLYSSETVENIPGMHEELYPFGTSKLLELIPHSSQKIIMGLMIWQWFGILILLACAYLLHRVLSIIIGLFVNHIIRRFTPSDKIKTLIRRLSKPASIIIIIFFVQLFVPVLQLSVKLNLYIFMGFKIIISIAGIMIAYRLVDLLAAYMSKAAAKTEGTLDDQLVPLVSKALRVFVIVIGVLFALQNLNFNITALLAGISIGGIAFALAAQDTLKNLFGSFTIFLDKPFQIGDWIQSTDIDGMVEEVGFRTTRIRTFQNSLISVPNGKLADMTINNMGLRVYRRFYSKISITYDTPPDLIESFTEGLREIVRNHPHTRKDYYEIHFNDMADYALIIMFYVFFKTENWSEELKCRHQILIAIMKLAEKLGIRFAFPTETLFIEQMPGQESLSPNYPDNRDEMRKKVSKFINYLKNTRPFKPEYQEKTPKAPLNMIQEQEQKKTFDENTVAPSPAKKEPEKQEKPERTEKKEIQDVRRNLVEKSIKKGKELTREEILDAAKKYDFEPAVLRALIEVESRQKGFFSNGKPRIIFHGHRFWKELEKRNINPEEHAAKNQDILYPRWSRKFYNNDEKEYERLEKAKSIHKEAAYAASSWGMFQIPGSLYDKCNFKSINEFVYNQFMTENEQLESFIEYLKNRGIKEDADKHQWQTVARKYNGANFAKKSIDIKLEKAYQKYKEEGWNSMG
jgi:MscS family membrane protein